MTQASYGQLVIASLLAACLLASEPNQTEPTQNVPVLTVCEALTGLKSHAGKDVVLVGLSGPTIEGTFISESCEADGRLSIQGHRWLSMVEVSGDEKFSSERARPNFDESVLRAKLLRVAATTRLSAGAKDNPFSGRWRAVFGRLVSPGTLRPPRPPSNSRTENLPGNGFGANGSVPARILQRGSFDLSKLK